MNAYQPWFRRGYGLLFMCSTALSLVTGCCSTKSPPGPSGMTSTSSKSSPPKDSSSSWSLFGDEAKKPQTPNDFLSQPRPSI